MEQSLSKNWLKLVTIVIVMIVFMPAVSLASYCPAGTTPYFDYTALSNPGAASFYWAKAPGWIETIIRWNGTYVAWPWADLGTAYTSGSYTYFLGNLRGYGTGPAGGYFAYYEVCRRDNTPPAPYCSISLSPNPINRGGGSTLSWSSSGSLSSFYIANVGYVSSSGSTTVYPSSSISYAGTVYGPGGSRSCSGTQTLTVYQTCAWNGSTIYHGQSVTAYQNASLPYGSSCVSQTRSCSNGSLSGSYSYASCTVDTLPPPPSSLSISADPSILFRNGTTNLTWSSTGATSCSVTGGGQTWSGTASPSGGQATGPVIGEVTYTLTCQNAGGETSASTSVRVLPSYEET